MTLIAPFAQMAWSSAKASELVSIPRTELDALKG
jgi:hypothetical protein